MSEEIYTNPNVPNLWDRKDYCHTADSSKNNFIKKNLPQGKKVQLFLTDPPYNIGFKYGKNSDNKEWSKYKSMIEDVLNNCFEAADRSAHLFLIHYPEAIARMWDIIENKNKWKFHQWITWVYPSNIGRSEKKWTRASRAIIWLKKGTPKFYPKRIVRHYRNPRDKRVSEHIKSGKKGCNLYDWWRINLCKNVSKDKRKKNPYPNQIPEILLKRIIISTTEVGDIVADPFAGTFSTVLTAIKLGRFGWGCDSNEDTKQYWPKNEDFKFDHIDKDYQFDIPYLFDHIRAGISENLYEKMLKEGAKKLANCKKYLDLPKLVSDELERIAKK